MIYVSAKFQYNGRKTRRNLQHKIAGILFTGGQTDKLIQVFTLKKFVLCVVMVKLGFNAWICP